MNKKISKSICEWINDLVNQGNSQAEAIAKLEESCGEDLREEIEKLKNSYSSLEYDIQQLTFKYQDLEDKISGLEICCETVQDSIKKLEKKIDQCCEGNSIIVGENEPGGCAGEEKDIYIQLNDGLLYERKNGSWELLGAISLSGGGF